MTELTQKLTKHFQKTLDTRRLHEGKYLCKNLGVNQLYAKFIGNLSTREAEQSSPQLEKGIEKASYRLTET